MQSMMSELSVFSGAGTILGPLKFIGSKDNGILNGERIIYIFSIISNALQLIFG